MKWVKHIFFKVGLSEHLWQTLTQADNQCEKFAWGLLQNNALKGIIGQIRLCFFSVFTCFVFCSDKGTRACISAEENAAYKESHYHFMRGVAITSRHILLDVSRQLCRQKTVHFPAFFSEVFAPFFVLEKLRFWLTNQICPTISHFPDKWSKIEIHEMGARDCVHDYLPVTFPLFSNKSCSLSPPKFVAGMTFHAPQIILRFSRPFSRHIFSLVHVMQMFVAAEIRALAPSSDSITASETRWLCSILLWHVRVWGNLGFGTSRSVNDAWEREKTEWRGVFVLLGDLNHSSLTAKRPGESVSLFSIVSKMGLGNRGIIFPRTMPWTASWAVMPDSWRKSYFQ